MADSSYAYSINYCHNIRQLGKLVNVLKDQRPRGCSNATFSLNHFDLYDSCFDRNGFLDKDLVSSKQRQLLHDESYPEFPYHAVMLLGAAGSGKSTSVQYLNTYLSGGLYCSYTNIGTDNINSRLESEQSEPFGTLLSSMRMTRLTDYFEQQNTNAQPSSFKEAQLVSLAYDWYNVSSMMACIRERLPEYVPFAGTKEEENDYLWMLSSLFRTKDRSDIPQIAVADFILLDESGVCPFEKLNSLAFLIYMVRCYFQVKLDKTPVFILVGSVSQSHATKGVPDNEKTGLKRVVETQSALDYVLKTEAVSKYTGIYGSGRILVFVKNKRCGMKKLKGLLSSLDLGKNSRCYAHVVDAIVVPKELIENPELEKIRAKRGKKSDRAASEGLNTADLDLSGYTRIALTHNVLSEYRKKCYKHLKKVEYPVYAVVMLNEVRSFAKGGSDTFAFLDLWLNDPNNGLGSYSQFRETLGGDFRRASGIVEMEKEYWPPLSIVPCRPCPFANPLNENDFKTMNKISAKEKIRLVLYESHVNLLMGKPVICQKKSVLYVTGFSGRFSKLMHLLYNGTAFFSSPAFLISILQSAIVHLENILNGRDRFEAMETDDDDFDEDEFLAVGVLQEKYSFIMYLNTSQASKDQMSEAVSEGMDVLSVLYKDVKSSYPRVDEEDVYFYTKDLWKGNSSVHFLASKDILYSKLGIGTRLTFLDTRDVPEQIIAKTCSSKYNPHFPQMKKKSALVLTDDGFVGLLPPVDNVYEIIDAKQKCVFKPLISVVSPITDDMAMTVNKSQGLTIPRVAGIVSDSMSMEAFYVMISRAKDDLVLSKNILLSKNFRYKPNEIMYRLMRSNETRIVL